MGKKVSAVKMDFLVVVVVFFPKQQCKTVCGQQQGRKSKVFSWHLCECCWCLAAWVGSCWWGNEWEVWENSAFAAEMTEGRHSCCAPHKGRDLWCEECFILCECAEREGFLLEPQRMPQSLWGQWRGRSTNQPCSSRELFGGCWRRWFGLAGASTLVPGAIGVWPLGFTFLAGESKSPWGFLADQSHGKV